MSYALYITLSWCLLVSEQVVNVGAEFTSKYFMKAQKESSGKTWNFLAAMCRYGWVANATLRPLYSRE